MSHLSIIGVGTLSPIAENNKSHIRTSFDIDKGTTIPQTFHPHIKSQLSDRLKPSIAKTQ